MNILHISRTMGQGGAEKVVFQLCKDIKNHKHIVASTGGVLVDELKKIGIKHYIIPDLNKKNPILIIKTLIILLNIIKNENIDIIHSHHRMAAFYSKIISLFNKRIKRVYTAHNVFYDKKRIVKFCLNNSNIIAVGNSVKKNLISVYEINSQIKVITNSIEVSNNQNKIKNPIFENKKDKIYIGNIGRLSYQKGYDIFLKSLQTIINSNKNVYGIIVGDGELKSDLIALSKELKIEDNIIFMGYRSDVLDIIKYLDFVVLSSRWEGFPLTPIEVFSQRKTLIASDIDGNNDIVINGYNGLLFEKDSIKDLSLRINDLIYNSKQVEFLEKNAYKDYQEKYSYSVFIKQYEDYYNRI